MLIIPALDLRQGTSVRLLQGRFDAVTEYGDPSAQLRIFSNAGAEWVHIVDLDGAREGRAAQRDLIAQLVANTNLRVQSGGGVRSHVDVQALLDAGVARVVVGSVAARKPEEVRGWINEFGAEQICIALDVRASETGYAVAVDGWVGDSGLSLDALLEAFPPGVLRHALVTDISRDGALSGPNVALIEMLIARRPDVEWQASGGVAALDDLRTLKAAGARASIVGRALYEKRFSLEDALAL